MWSFQNLFTGNDSDEAIGAADAKNARGHRGALVDKNIREAV